MKTGNICLRRRPQHNEGCARQLAWTLGTASARDRGPATRGLRGSALLLNPRREAAAAAAGGGGARSAAPRPGRSRGLQRSRAEPEPSPDALRPPAGSREPRSAGASEVAAQGAPRAGERGGPGTRPGRRCLPAAGDGEPGPRPPGPCCPGRPAGRERECEDPTLGAPSAGTCSLSLGREDPSHSRDSQKRSPQGTLLSLPRWL